MIDQDARMWAENGTEMTPVELHKRGNCQQELRNWLEEHTTGEFVITPWLVFFEFETEATFFNLAYSCLMTY